MGSNNQNPEDALVSEISKLSLEEAASEGGRADKPNNQIVTYHKSAEDGKKYVPVQLSLGFRFHPNDHEIMQYLNKKISEDTAACMFIPSANVYELGPDELAGMYPSVGEGEWYFFSARYRKYTNGGRPSRGVGGKGYWKANGRGGPVKHNGVEMGSKMSLTFHEGKPPRGRKTQWNMIEFVSMYERQRAGLEDMRLDDCVLCRIYWNSSGTEEAGEKSSETKKQRKRKRGKAEDNGAGHGIPLALDDLLVSQNLPGDMATGAHSFEPNQHHGVPVPPPQQERELHLPRQQQNLQNPPPVYCTWDDLGQPPPQQQPRLCAQQQRRRLGAQARARQQHRPEQQQSLQNPQQYLPCQQPNLQNPRQSLPGQQQIPRMAPQQEWRLQVPQQHHPWQQADHPNPQRSLPGQQQIPQMPRQEPRMQVPQQHHAWQQTSIQNPQQYLPEQQPFLQMPQQQTSTQMLQPNLPRQHSHFPTPEPVGQHHLDSVQYSHQAGSQDLSGMLHSQQERFPEELVREYLPFTGDQNFLELLSFLHENEENDFNTAGGVILNSPLNDNHHPQHVSDMEMPHTTSVTINSQLASVQNATTSMSLPEPRQD